jgi:hypothetical protein
MRPSSANHGGIKVVSLKALRKADKFSTLKTFDE